MFHVEHCTAHIVWTLVYVANPSNGTMGMSYGEAEIGDLGRERGMCGAGLEGPHIRKVRECVEQSAIGVNFQDKCTSCHATV
jgi:hypothetical protein